MTPPRSGAGPSSGGGAAFDETLLSSVRLGVVTSLFARGALTFSELKDLLGVTQGNLGIHLGKLESAGYVAIEKEFVDRRPCTTARLTAAGRRAFVSHVERLSKIAQGG